MNSIFEFNQRILDIGKELLSKTYVHFLNKKKKQNKKNLHRNVGKKLALYNNYLGEMIFGSLPLPKVVQENLTDMIKLYIRYGPDYNLIAKQFQGIVEQKISTKFISQFCFNLNKKTYEIIVDYLKQHKEQKGEKQFNYDNLWPATIDDPQLRTQIENLPTDIIRILNKDLSEAYNLLMESLSDPTLKKLIKYDRIRDLYQFVTEIILNKKNKPKRQRKDKKDPGKETSHKKSQIKNVRTVEKQHNQQVIVSSKEWSSIQQRYLSALYLERPLVKCCQKMNQKFGENEKWNTTKKIFKKSEEIFQKYLKKTFKSSYFKSLKHILDDLQTSKDNLISQIVKKKTNQIQKSVLKYFRTADSDKKMRNLQEISTQILTILQRPDILQKISEQIEVVKKEDIKKIKQEEKTLKQMDLQTDQLEKSQTKITQIETAEKIKIETGSQVKIDYIELEKAL